MANYAFHINRLKLYQELDKSTGRDGIQKEDIIILKGMVNYVAETVGPDLERIKQTFTQYTEHDIQHCRNVIDLMGRIIPEETLGKLNGLELSFLILAGLLHDTGMIVSDSEKETFLQSADFKSFCDTQIDKQKMCNEEREKGNELRARTIEDTMLAEYIRRVHLQRTRTYIMQRLKLVFQETDVNEDVATLSESHGWGLQESNDITDPNKAVSKLQTKNPINGVPTNLQYLACCLRLGDILDFDRSRTPAGVFGQIDFTDQKSWLEWNKHLSVKGWIIHEKGVEYSVRCTHPTFYIAIQQFLNEVDKELTECRYLVDEKPAAITKRYKLDLPQVVDRRQIRMKDKKYVPGDFRFQLEYEEIMKLLMDRSLYPDPSFFLRELLQNALDACRHMEGLYKERKLSNYEPKIAIWDMSNDQDDPRIIFQDNGLGMSLNIIKYYFLRIGKSYYRSTEFDAERERLSQKGISIDTCSYFGIGILSCFMVADWFEVETYRFGNKPIYLTIEGPSKYFLIEELPQQKWDFHMPLPELDEKKGPPVIPGTRITIHLRKGTEVNVLKTIKNFAVNVEFDICVYSTCKKKHVVQKLCWSNECIREGLLTDRTVNQIRNLKGVLKNVLVPSHIPLGQSSLSKVLSGELWLWFLRGEDGNPTPFKGFLMMRGRNLILRGAGAIVRDLTNIFHSLVENSIGSRRRPEYWRDEWLARVWNHLNCAVGDVNGMAHMTMEGLVRGRLPVNIKKLVTITSQLFKLKVSERKAVVDAIHKTTFERTGRIGWTEIPEAWQGLLDGRFDWMEQYPEVIWEHEAHAFPTAILEVISPFENSLRGILLPAGITSWHPSSVTSTRIRKLIPVAGGGRVDIRGSDAPIPTANRMAAELSDSFQFIILVSRVVIRHALQLVLDSNLDRSWVDWFKWSFSHKNRFATHRLVYRAWREAYKIEHEYVTQVIK